MFLQDPEDLKTIDSSSKSDSVKTDPDEIIKAHRKLIKLLLIRVKQEENSRLKTEEQTSRLVAEQEQTIEYLEQKIKELEELLSQTKEVSTDGKQKLNDVKAKSNFNAYVLFDILKSVLGKLLLVQQLLIWRTKS